MRPPTQNAIMQMVNVTFTADMSQPYISAKGVANSDQAYTKPSTRNEIAAAKRYKYLFLLSACTVMAFSLLPNL